MKFPLYSCLFFVVGIAGCSGDNAEKTASGAVSKAVEMAKGAATGVTKGVDDGRKSSNSSDGAIIVSNGSDLKAALTGEVLEVASKQPGDEPSDAAKAVATLGFQNTAASPVRVTGLAHDSHVTALDSEGYACATRSVGDEFTVPAKAKFKVDMAFDCGKKTIAMVRLFDVEYPVAK